MSDEATAMRQSIASVAKELVATTNLTTGAINEMMTECGNQKQRFEDGLSTWMKSAEKF